MLGFSSQAKHKALASASVSQENVPQVQILKHIFKVVVSTRYFFTIRTKGICDICLWTCVCLCVATDNNKGNIVKQMELEKLVIHMEKKMKVDFLLLTIHKK